MAIVIKPKKSETGSAVPSTSDLALGEMAVNTADKKIYVRNSGGTVVEVANGAGGVSEATATAKAIVMAVALG
tara:strand:+ start:200 stop:418 length:219 start_codon:yes stop_codon:yes gene_type:complete